MTIEIKNLTNKTKEYNRQIDILLDDIGIEKKYFQSINKKLILNSSILIAAIDKNEIIGLTGINEKSLNEKYIIVKKEYHGFGLGRKLTKRIISESQKKHNAIVSIIKVNNIAPVNLNISLGAKPIGVKSNQYYLMNTFNFKGELLYCFIKIIFPIFKFKDWLENWFLAKKNT